MNEADVPQQAATESDQLLMRQATEGRTAQELIEDPHVVQYFRELETVIYSMLRTGTPDEAAHWHRMLDCADKLREVWLEHVRTGRIAAEKLRDRQHPLLQLSRWKWLRRA